MKYTRLSWLGKVTSITALLLLGVFGVSASEVPGPGKNVMNCTNPIGTGIKDGNLACYGIWDYGNEFGEDSDMCEDDEYMATTGCQVKTKACTSGIATATKYYKPIQMSLSSSELTTFAQNLQSSTEAVKSQIPGLWIYNCGKNTVPVEELGTYKGYMDGSSSAFIVTENITKAKALENCKLNSKNNPTKSIYCTWKGVEIYSFTPKQDDIAPRKNAMSCSSPSLSNQTDGELACYGIWDDGDAFGDDSAMCPKDAYSNGKTGCQIQTKACSSGIATATKFYTPGNMSTTSSEMLTFSKNLNWPVQGVKSYIFGLWVYTCGEQTVPTEETGTYKGYLNGSSSPFITTENITKAAALENCKLNSKNNSTKSIYCTWKGDEIYSYTPRPIEETGVLNVYVDGTNIMTGIDMTQSVALTQCKNKANSYPNSEIRCTWNKSQIFYQGAQEDRATYIVYRDGEKISQSYDITKAAAQKDCTMMQILYPNSSLRCIWDGVEFYNYEGEDDQDCSYGYEYVSSLDRCIKSSSLTYYSLMQREYGSTISRLSVSKLKLVLERIEDIEYKYTSGSTTRLKLEALKLVIETEIRKQEGDDFDFSDLFD